MSKKLFAAFVASVGLAAAAPASAIIVGGVDFGTIGESQHLETTTLAETLITGNGQELVGYGVVDRVNGLGSYMAGSDKLFFYFSGYQSVDFVSGAGGDDSVGFTGGTIQVFYGADFNLLTQSSEDNITTILGYTPWATFGGHADANGYTLFATGALVGATIGFEGKGLLDVVSGLADVVEYLDQNNIDDLAGGFADMALGTEGNNKVLNPSDTCTGVAGQFCVQGTASIRGTIEQAVVPEPGIIALLGLGAVGLGISTRKRKMAAAH